MNFFKNVLSSCLGVMLAFVAVGLIGGLAVASSMAGDKGVVKESVLELSLDQLVPEQTGNVPTTNIFVPGSNTLGLRDLNRMIDHAATDDKIPGILLNLSGVMMGQSTLTSVREHLESFKESGKFIYAYGDAYSQGAYLLATVADSIFVNPQGGVDVKGYAAMIPFFKEAMDELGIKVNIFYAGNFKSATEPFRRNDISEPNALQTREYLNGMYDIYADLVADSRGISREQLDDIAANMKGRNAQSSLDNRLVDGIAYATEVHDMIKEKIGADADKKLKVADLEKYRAGWKKDNGNASDKIAIVYAEGTVVYDDDGKGVISEKKLVDVLRRIKRKKSVKAVVLRVNSGGGSALTSDIIHHEIEQIKESGKKVIASFGDLAASGGYYIAAGADSIVSAPNTITGSIGVFAMLPNFSEFARERLLLNFDTIKTHPMALGLSGVYDISEKERDLLQESVIDIYERFTTVVAEGRGLPMEEVKEIAQGRVYTGLRAKEIGLVDVIGYLDDAIQVAATSAGLDEYKVVEYPAIEVDPFEEILNSIMSGSAGAATALPMDAKTKRLVAEYNKWKPILQSTEVQARFPYVMVYE